MKFLTQRIFWQMATVLTSIAVTLVATEMSLSIFYPQRTLSELKKQQLVCYRSSKFLPYEYQPDCVGEFVTGRSRSHVRINNIGLRGKDIGEKKGKRIVVVGDSFIFGYGVKEGEDFSWQLARILGVEAINAGVWGYGPDAEYLWTREVGVNLKPDLVIVGIFAGNDLRDVAESNWQTDERGKLVSITNSKFVDREGFLRRHKVSRRLYIPVVNESHLLALIDDRLGSLIAEKNNLPETFDESQLDLLCLYRLDCQSQWQEARDKLESVISWFGQLSNEYNLPVVFILIPEKRQLGGEYPAKTLFDEMLTENQLPYLNLTEYFSKSGLKLEEILIPDDDHWTPLGNKLAADITARWLESLK